MCSLFKKMFIFVLVLIIIEVSSGQEPTPPKVEGPPVLLESYLPATMQILAYLTEMMKYDLKPTTTPPYGPTTTSTIRPTPYHRPAIYAPLKPPGPEAYFQRVSENGYREYIESLKRPSGNNYFDRYNQDLSIDSRQEARSSRNLGDDDNDDILEGVASYFGRNFIDTLKLAKVVEKDVPNDIDEQSQEFLKKYDDSNFRTELFRQKQVPPTRAYVNLLSLYDMLNKESKRLGLSKYNGYTQKILEELVDTSSNTSAYQLRTVLKKVLERRDVTRTEIVNKIKLLAKDLDDPDSYLNMALKYIPPLVFSL